jgi:hypothetical protein
MNEDDCLEDNWFRKANPGWYQYTLEYNREVHQDIYEFDRLYRKMSVWVLNNIEGSNKHVRGYFSYKKLIIIFRFRFDHDFVTFSLRWS